MSKHSSSIDVCILLSVLSLFLLLVAFLTVFIVPAHAQAYSYVAKFRAPPFALGLGIDKKGYVYSASYNLGPTTDINMSGVAKYDGNGNLIASWGSLGSDNNQFNVSTDVAVDSLGNIYVADVFNLRIVKFDSNGNFISKWGLFAQDGQFNFSNPSSGYQVKLAFIAIDDSGSVYVTEWWNHCVDKFDGNGNLITRWSVNVTTNDEIAYPYGIAVDSFGNVFVSAQTGLLNSVVGNVEKFDGNGHLIKSWHLAGNETFRGNGITTDTQGNIYLADVISKSIYVFDGNGTFITKWKIIDLNYSTVDTPIDVVVDTSGNVYVSGFLVQNGSFYGILEFSNSQQIPEFSENISLGVIGTVMLIAFVIVKSKKCANGGLYS